MRGVSQERRIATGDFSGQLAIWDFDRDAPVYSVAKAHTGLVNAIDGCVAGAPQPPHCVAGTHIDPFTLSAAAAASASGAGPPS